MREIDKINSVIFELADTQREFAWNLNEHLLELNRQIVSETIRLIGAEESDHHIKSVARIPGNSSLFLLRDGSVFPEEQRDKIYKIMGERIYFVHETNSKKLLISRILGRDIDRNCINIEEKIGVAHIPIEVVTPNIINKVQLAQQLSRVQIVKQ